MDWLNDLLSTVTGKDSNASPTGELERIQRREAEKPATREQEAEARRAGFKNHREYMAWLRQRQQQTGGTTEGSGTRQLKKGTDAAMSWHPARLLDYVSRAIDDATKKDK